MIGIVRGRPAIRSRPRTSIWSSRSSGSAVPIAILTSSAVRSPIIRLYFLRMYVAMCSSNLLPPTRSEVETTMPPSAMTAISRRPAADVDDHVPGRSADRDVRADRGGERLLDQVGLLGAGLERRVADGPLLDRRDAGRDADHHLRLAEADPALRRLGDEEAEHRLGDDVVGDHAVLHRPDGLDVARGPADHLAGLLAHGDDPVVVRDRHDGRFGDDDPLALDVDKDVGRAEINTDLHEVVETVPSARRSILAPRSRNLRSMFSYPR